MLSTAHKKAGAIKAPTTDDLSQLTLSGSDSNGRFCSLSTIPSFESQTGKEKMILLYILGSKQPLLCPEVAIGGVLIPLYQQQCWRYDTLCLNILAGGRYRLILTAFDTKLGDTL